MGAHFVLRTLLICGGVLSLLSACSMAAVRFIEIPPQGNVAPSVLFERARVEVPAVGLGSADPVCSEQNLSIARYATKSENLRIALVLNEQTGVVALQITEYGVSAFSPSAEQEYQSLLSHLRFQMGSVREHVSEQDVPVFGKRLYNNGQRLTTCG
jgi:hypothetical protein